MCPSCTLLAKADVDPFVWRDASGVRFANRVGGQGRFRDRHWPALQRPRRAFAQRRHYKPRSACSAKVVRAIETAAQVACARRWIPMNPLEAHAMRAEDALRD